MSSQTVLALAWLAGQTAVWTRQSGQDRLSWPDTLDRGNPRQLSGQDSLARQHTHGQSKDLNRTNPKQVCLAKGHSLRQTRSVGTCPDPLT